VSRAHTVFDERGEVASYKSPREVREFESRLDFVGALIPAVQDAAASRNGATPSRAAHSWRPVDLLGLEIAPPSPPTIGRTTYPGKRHLYSGESETLKTWKADVDAAEELRAGRCVVYLDFEMGAADQLGRLRDLGVTDEELGRLVYITPSEPITEMQVRADVQALLAEFRPSLAIVDAFTGALEIHGLNPDKGVEVERFYRTVVQPFQDAGAAVILLDHVAKNRDARGRYSIASERKLAAVDVHLGFELVRPFGRGKTGLAKLITHKDRFGHLPRPKAAEFELTSDPVSGRVTWQLRLAEPSDSDHGFRPTTLMRRVSEFVGAEAEPPSRNRVEEHVTGKRDFVRQAVDVLLAEGYLGEEDGPRNALLLRFVKPFREDADDGR
jgi:hypothetical protein